MLVTDVEGGIKLKSSPSGKRDSEGVGEEEKEEQIDLLLSEDGSAIPIGDKGGESFSYGIAFMEQLGQSFPMTHKKTLKEPLVEK